MLIRISSHAAHFYFYTQYPMAPLVNQEPMVFCQEDATLAPLPQPIFGLPCHDTCLDGTFATVDRIKRQLICDTCPQNTYSVGEGGIRIDGQMGAFGYLGEDGNSMPLRMEKSCQVHSGSAEDVFYRDESCTPWVRTGTSLKAFQASVTDVLVDFDLTYPVFFDDEGSVEFKYRKDSIGTNDTTYGVFKFLIDGEVQLQDSDPKHTGFESALIDKIPAGFHTFIWRYTKLNILPFTEFLEAEIEVSTRAGCLIKRAILVDHGARSPL